MGIFSGPKKKDELVLVFSIGSSFVEGALFWAQSSGIPKMIFSAREPINIEKKIDINNFLSLTIKSLETIIDKIYKAGLGAPSRIFCVLSSPWYVSEVRTISFNKNVPFIFNTKLADELIQKEIKIFEEEHKEKYKNIGNEVRVIELKNIKTMLNGYEISNPLNQKTKEVEMTIFISISGEEVLKRIEGVISKHFNSSSVKFSSFVIATFTVVRDLYAKKENFLLVYIGGEVTDISMVKRNVLQESISFPLGCNFLTREVANSLGCTLDEAGSFISLYKDGHAEEETSKKLEVVIRELKKEWLKNFQESLANISNDISIPATIYMYMGKDLAEFFSETIKTEQFSQYTLTESKFEIIFINTELLHGTAIFEELVIREPFLIIDAIYINRFLINPVYLSTRGVMFGKNNYV